MKRDKKSNLPRKPKKRSFETIEENSRTSQEKIAHTAIRIRELLFAGLAQDLGVEVDEEGADGLFVGLGDADPQIVGSLCFI